MTHDEPADPQEMLINLIQSLEKKFDALSQNIEKKLEAQNEEIKQINRIQQYLMLRNEDRDRSTHSLIAEGRPHFFSKKTSVLRASGDEFSETPDAFQPEHPYSK